jgi:hypothetical protein
VFAGGNHSWAIRDVVEFERRAEQWQTQYSHRQQLSIINAEKDLHNFSIAEEGLLLEEVDNTDYKND